MGQVIPFRAPSAPCVPTHVAHPSLHNLMALGAGFLLGAWLVASLWWVWAHD